MHGRFDDGEAQRGQAWPRVDARRKVARNRADRQRLLSGVESEDAGDSSGSSPELAAAALDACSVIDT